MAQRHLSRELIDRLIDETPCAWCGYPLELGDVAYLDHGAGKAYCSPDHAAEDRIALPLTTRSRDDYAA